MPLASEGYVTRADPSCHENPSEIEGFFVAVEFFVWFGTERAVNVPPVILPKIRA